MRFELGCAESNEDGQRELENRPVKRVNVDALSKTVVFSDSASPWVGELGFVIRLVE